MKEVLGFALEYWISEDWFGASAVRFVAIASSLQCYQTSLHPRFATHGQHGGVEVFIAGLHFLWQNTQNSHSKVKLMDDLTTSIFIHIFVSYQ